MTKTNLRKIWWIITTLYISFIYATLGNAPAIWKSLNSLLGGKGVVAQYIIYSLVFIGVFIYILWVKKERLITRYLLFFLFISIFFIMVEFEKNPAEKIHTAQYGLFGVLLYNALKIDFNPLNKNLYLCGFFICLVAGTLDEVIQGILPNRVFTWHDIFINGISGIIALLIIRFNILNLKIDKDPPYFSL